MSKTLLVFGAVTAVIVIVAISLLSWGVGVNNSIVIASNEVDNKIGFMQSAYQRRADLLPNLAKVVNRYAKHEKGTFVETAEARSKAAGEVKLTPETLNNPQAMAKFRQAQGDISSFFSKLMVIQEQYPELKADRLFIDLQAQVEGTENRIKVERDNYNNTVRDYNNKIGVFPASVVASFRGFSKRPAFQADAGAEKAPHLQMND